MLVGSRDIADLKKISLHTVSRQEIKMTGARIFFNYKHYFPTLIGLIEQKKYYALVEAIALREYEGWLVDSWEEYYRDFDGVFKRQARIFALEAYAMGLEDHEDAVMYIKFNQKYRPGILRGREFPIVIAPCCNKEGYTTQAMIDAEHTICPQCGRFTEVKLLGYGVIIQGTPIQQAA